MQVAVTAVVVVVPAVVLTVWRHNGSTYLTGFWDNGSQTLVFGRMLQMQQNQTSPGGFMGVYTQDWSDEQNRYWYRDNTPVSPQDFQAYTHQTGLQGWAFGVLNKVLYEEDGQLSMIPWDYNLALGGMGGMGGGMPGGSGETEESSGATSVVNSPIDDAFSGTDFFDTLLEKETYHSQYDAYLQQLVSEYINGGGFDAFYERVRSQIDELVETDPTAFYSYDEYETAAETLYQVVKLRGQSIQGQLDGTIPSTEEAQRDSDALVDASDLDLSVMGTMNMGGGDGKAPAKPQNESN